MKLATAKALLGLSVVAFGASLTQDAFYISGSNPNAYASALWALLLGWLGLFDGVIAWLGNPLLITSWVLLVRGKPQGAVLASGAGSLAIASFLLQGTITSDEAGNSATITGVGAGYWLWMSSAGLATICGAVLCTTKEKLTVFPKRPNQSPEPTVMSVTSPADAGAAPATTVAHL